MKLETVMRKIQEADVFLASMQYEPSYDFGVDMNNALKKIGHYSVIYYERCEKQGLTYEQATEKLGEYLRSNLTLVVEEYDKNEQAT